MILVFAVAAGVPRFGTRGHRDDVLAAGARGVAGEVPACERESAGHYCEEGLYVLAAGKEIERDEERRDGGVSVRRVQDPDELLSGGHLCLLSRRLRRLSWLNRHRCGGVGELEREGRGKPGWLLSELSLTFCRWC